MPHELLEAYPAVVDIPVAWGEMDAYGHVNNAVYFRWFESARMAYFDPLGVHEIKQLSGIGPILASTSCRFRIPLTYPDQVSIGATVAGVERSEEFVIICSWCKLVEVESGWLEVEEAIDKLGLFDEPVLPRISHGCCSPCFERMGHGHAAPALA